MSGQKLVGVGLIVAMLAVWAVRSFVFDGSDPNSDVATAPMVDVPSNDDSVVAAPGDRGTQPGPVAAAGDLAGVPVGYPRSTPGAATSAVNWVASFPTIVRMGPIRLDDTLGRLLSKRRAVSGTDEVIADYFTLIDKLGPDFADRIWIESPLQVNVIDASESSPTVEVWSALVTGDPKSGPIEALWRTHRIELIWERNDWRIDDVTITEGPTPVPNEVALPSPPSDFVEVDGWEPAVFADTTSFGEGG